jgi:MFS family permease
LFMNVVFSRTLFLAMILNGMCFICLAYSGCNLPFAITFFTLSLTLHGAVSTGVLAAMVDIAPNFSGIVMGVSGTFGVISGFLSPMIVGYITYSDQSVYAWRKIFQICAILIIGCGFIHMTFLDTDVQSWNGGKNKQNKSKQQMSQYKISTRTNEADSK